MSEKFRVLIGYDGSECSSSALEGLRRAGLPDETEAIVFSVSDVWEEPGAFDHLASSENAPSTGEMNAIHNYLAAALKEGEALAEKGGEIVKAYFPTWEVHSESRSGIPAWEIIERSDSWKADLLVVGSQGRSAFGRAILGSVSQKVLHEANCSVRISRYPVSDRGAPTRVLIAVDGSEYAVAAVKAAAARQWAAGTEFRIITADDDPGGRPEVSLIDYMPEGKKDSAEAEEWIRRVVERPRQILNAAGYEASQFIRWGDARRTILNEANDWKADMIFMGARGIGRFQRFLLGSVSSAIAAKANCSVEIIR